jgi:hypothetical protein
MEMSPIPGIRVLLAVDAPQGDLRLPEVFEIEGSARPGDGERQRGGRKGSDAEENDADEQIEDDLMVDADAEPGGTSGESSARSVDYFA